MTGMNKAMGFERVMATESSAGDWPVAPWWLPGGNAQTIWSALRARPTLAGLPDWHRQRWHTPDGDFIDVDSHLPLGAVAELSGKTGPHLVLFHGLEGSSHSPYAQAFAEVAGALGWSVHVPHFRGCSGEVNWAPRAYHSGDHEEIAWVLGQFKRLHPGSPLLAVGVSLGGNALFRWAQEMGNEATRWVAAVAAVSSPLDLGAAGHAIDRGFNRWVYARMFLRTMVAKAEAKWRQFPGLFDLERVRRARTLYEFDDVFTGPLHGFRGTDDYWQRAAAKPRLRELRLPALALNARNDPFIPAGSLATQRDVSDWVTLWQPETGGHAGFCVTDAGNHFPGHVQHMPVRVCAWLKQAAGV